MKSNNHTKRVTENHRTQAGRARRAGTQSRIIKAALQVFAAKGPDAPVIDDFIKAAGVSRGTFYNYYKSTGELLEATSAWLEDDLIISIMAEIGEIDSPLERVTCGMLLWMKKAESDPVWCSFIRRVTHHSPMVEAQVGGDLAKGLQTGVFNFRSHKIAYDLVVGTVRQTMDRMLEEKLPRGHMKEVASLVLQGLGVDRDQIDKALNRPLPKMRRAPHSIG